MRLGNNARAGRPTRSGGEPGNLIVMGLGLWVVVISLILVLTSAIHLHTVRRDLLNHTDAIALELAQDISDSAYYSGCCLSLQPAQPASGQFSVGEYSATYTARVEGTAVVVTAQTTAHIPFVPQLLLGVGEVNLAVRSSAELATMP